MANVPQQLPHIDLPGAEYFTLTPGGTILLERRLTQSIASNVFAVPASGVIGVTVNFVLDPNWTYGHGAYLVRVYSLCIPQDVTSELQVVQARMGVGQAPTNINLDLGIPTLTLATPAGPQVAIYDRDALITFLDTPAAPPNQPLSIIFQQAFKNLDATNPHSMQISGVAVWHRCNGFVQ